MPRLLSDLQVRHQKLIFSMTLIFLATGLTVAGAVLGTEMLTDNWVTVAGLAGGFFIGGNVATHYAHRGSKPPNAD